MLDVPGCCDSHRLPKAVAVVKRTPDHCAGQTRLQKIGLPGAPGHDVVDLEGHADTQQQRQCNDVGEIQRHADQDTNLQRHDACEQQRDERQQHIAEPPQNDPQQDGNRDQRVESGLQECPDDGPARFKDGNRPAGCIRIDGEHGARERPQHLGVVGIAFRGDFDACAPVRRDPLAFERVRQIVFCNPLRAHEAA